MSLRFLEKALALNIKYYGAKSLKVAVSYHLVARTQSCMGNFRSALTNEKEAFTIYKTQVRKSYCNTKFYIINYSRSFSLERTTKKPKSLPNA